MNRISSSKQDAIWNSNRRINEKGAKSRAENELWRNVAKNNVLLRLARPPFPTSCASDQK